MLKKQINDKSHKNAILIYGGSFDPPHLGHLNIALNVQRHFCFDQFFFVPCKNSPLKNSTLASSAQRVDMLKLLLQNHPQFSISTCEIDRDTPSYMVDTLELFRQKFSKQTSITLLLGRDAFLNLTQWHDWERIPMLCNVLVTGRPEDRSTNQDINKFRKGALSSHGGQNKVVCIEDEGLVITQALKQKFSSCQSNPLSLLKSPLGQLVYFNAGSFEISSTDIRQSIQMGASVDFGLSKEIQDYIKVNKLYTGITSE